MDLFNQSSQEVKSEEPLASRMRPRNLGEYFGQRQILQGNSLLRRVIEADTLSSVVFYGPPGSGKTTLAHIISNHTKAHFEALNAVVANVSDIRKMLDKAKAQYKANGKKTILFIDEIHRFSKSQQDVLMPDIEKGNPILIGATTHNPFFSIVSPLLSRSLVFELKPLSENEIIDILTQALNNKELGLGNYSIEMHVDALKFIASMCDGDARRALNALEIGFKTTDLNSKGVLDFTIKVAEDSIQKKVVRYDAKGDAHFDHASAYIKSMRGSDPDAAIYYLAKMLYAGEDPRFIARRLVICAAEDVGNADPQALVLANAALQISEFVGMPEARIPLAQATTYIAKAPKSNASYVAIDKAMKDVAEGRSLEVPKHLQDGHYAGAKKLGHGEGYKYDHDYKDNKTNQDHLTEKRTYYQPKNQ